MIAVDEPAGTPPPRLGIIHLLAWLTVAAVLFGIERWASSEEKVAGVPYLDAYRIIRFANLSLLSAGIVGTVTLLRWRRGGRPQPLAPGHWVLLSYTIPYFVGYNLSLVLRMFFSPELRGIRVWSWILVYVLQVAIYVRAAERTTGERGWRRIFELFTFSSAVELLINGTFLKLFAVEARRSTMPVNPFIQYCGMCSLAITAVIFIVFGMYDTFRVRRDWLHGLGVGLPVCTWLLTAGSWVLMYFVR